MAWALQHDGLNDRVALASDVLFGDTEEYVIELTFKIDADTGNDIHAWLGGTNSGDYFYYRISNNRMQWTFGGSSTILTIDSSEVLGNEITVFLVSDPVNGRRIEYNSNFSNYSASPIAYSVRYFGNGGFGWYADGALYRCKIYSDLSKTTVVNDYDPSASNGTGNTLIDTVGGNNGTLQNFPTDDSQWINLGGAVISITGSTANYNQSGVNSVLELYGSIEITAQTANYNQSAINSTLDLAGEISITGETANYISQGVNSTFTLYGDIIVTGQTANYNLQSNNADVLVFDLWKQTLPGVANWINQPKLTPNWTVTTAIETIWSKK